MSNKMIFTEQQMEKLDQLATKLEQAEDEAAVNSVLQEYGYQMSSTEGDELKEEDLEMVAGGLSEWDVFSWFLKNTDLGKLTWKGTKVAARCIYDGLKYGNCYRTYSKKEVNKINKDLDKAIPNWMKKLGQLGTF